MGELDNWFAYKVILQSGQMNNNLETVLLVIERLHSNVILTMHLADTEVWKE